MQGRLCVVTQRIVRWVSLPPFKDFQRFQRGCECYLLYRSWVFPSLTNETGAGEVTEKLL
jgi:hypothetical protein